MIKSEIEHLIEKPYISDVENDRLIQLLEEKKNLTDDERDYLLIAKEIKKTFLKAKKPPRQALENIKNDPTIFAQFNYDIQILEDAVWRLEQYEQNEDKRSH